MLLAALVSLGVAIVLLITGQNLILPAIRHAAARGRHALVHHLGHGVDYRALLMALGGFLISATVRRK
jgi:hypothetical protein